METANANYFRKFDEVKYTGYGTGVFSGEKCNCPVRLLRKLPLPGYWGIEAIDAHNAGAVPTIAHVRNLAPITKCT